MNWYSVRCVFKLYPIDGVASGSNLYEERITLWSAKSGEDAIALAEAEAEAYSQMAEGEPATFLGLSQSYQLYDDPAKSSSEIFSLIRKSSESSEVYLRRFFNTGDELQREMEDI